MFLLLKYALSAAMVVLISELARRNDKIGALVAALPLTTVLVLIWLRVEGQSEAKIAAHAWYTFWYVIPGLPAFLLFPFLMRQLGFWLALLAAIAITAALFWLCSVALKYWGIQL